ncbi:MAG: S1C family serine protease [Betaproteobacteria bacterium]
MLLALTGALSPSAPAAESSSRAPTPADADAFFAAIVQIEARALPDARSAATLGTEREGTGVIIARDGLTLTIGYLLIEADEVRIIDNRGRALPARVVAYDHVSGLGLVKPVIPLDVAPIALGDSSRLAASDPVLIVNRGGRDDATRALVVSRRMFTGNWEYLLESAIFTSPPALDWSGAALIGTDGALLGVGSLILRDATDGEPRVPGNMFVPIEVLKPILADLVGNGRRSGPVRPWLGVAADEEHGRLVVVRVSPGGPSDRAGIRAGDIILQVGGEGVHSQAEFYRKLWAKRTAGVTVPLRVLQGIDVHEIKVRSIDRVEYFKQKPSY